MALLTVEDLTVGSTFGTSAQLVFTGEGFLPPSNIGDLIIAGVKAQHPLDGRYLEGVPVPNRIDVTIDWKGATPGHVDFILNSVVHSEPAVTFKVSHVFDMGSDLRAGQNLLRIVAYDAQGNVSFSQDFTPFSLPAPIWMTSLIDLQVFGPMLMSATGSTSAGLEYSSRVKVPAYDITLNAPGFGPSGFGAKMDFYLGGRARLPLTCDSPYEIALEGGSDRSLSFFGIEAGEEMKASGQIRGEAYNCRVTSAKGSFNLEIKVYAQKDWPVLVLIADFVSPGAGELIEKAIPEPLHEFVMDAAGHIYVQLNLRANVSSDVETLDTSPWLQLRGLHLSAGPGIEGGYELKNPLMGLKVYIGAYGTIGFYNPNPLQDMTNLQFDNVIVTGEAGYTIQLGWWEQDQKFVIEWQYPPANSVLRPMAITQPGAWHFVPHSPAKSASNLRAVSIPLQAFAANNSDLDSSTTHSDTTRTSTLASNVYPYADPALSVNPVDNHSVMVWVYDDISKPVGQSKEIYFSLWDGATWTTPTGVTNDNLLDGAPRVAWANDGNAVAAWERLNAVEPITGTWDITTANQIEIATSIYSPTTGTWSPVALLTNNNILDMKPQLASNAAGALISVWRQNSTGQLMGDTTNPDRVMVDFYNSGWNTPTVAIDGIPGLADLAAGYGNGTATIAFTRYLTPAGWPTPTLQLFTSTWNGAMWSSPQQLTNDNMSHRNPQVVYNTLNQPILVWLAGPNLSLKNLTNGNVVSLTLPSNIGTADEFRVVQDTAGNIAAVFSAQGSQRDFLVAFYDQAHNQWGNPTQLTNDTASEAYPAAALDSMGRLLMGYASTAINQVTQTTTISGTGQVVSYTIPEEGQTDLMTLSHVFTCSLVLSDSDMAVSNDHPEPGSSVVVSATVHNIGDLALDHVVVAFYDGDPAAGASLVGSQSFVGPIAAGFTETLAFTYTVPITGGQHILYAVADPFNTISESNKSDNTARLMAFGPDMAITGAKIDYWGASDVGLMTFISNIGTTAAPTVTIAYYTGGLTGTPSVTDTVPALAPGQVVTLTTPWNFGALPNGTYTLTAMVNRGDFSETFTANNVYTFVLDVQPDLMVSPYYLWTTSPTATSVVFTATVFNVGAYTATDVLVGIYGSDQLDANSLLVTQTVPLLGPGGSAKISRQLRGPLTCMLYVYVDPNQTLTETTRSNNLADIPYRGTCQHVFLPMILRAR